MKPAGCEYILDASHFLVIDCGANKEKRERARDDLTVTNDTVYKVLLSVVNVHLISTCPRF